MGTELTGGKANRLSKLKILGFQVPHGTVLTTILYDTVIDQLGYQTPVSIENFPKIYQAFHNPSPNILTVIDLLLTDYRKSGKLFSVRSSATIEDSSQDSMAVIFQEMVPARCAGVIFGAKAQTGNLDIVEIEANPGLAEGIVSGKTQEIEQYKFIKSEKRIIERKGPVFLSQSEAKALFMLSERLRSEFNDIPQDIEWAIDQNGQIGVLQSRDLYLGK